MGINHFLNAALVVSLVFAASCEEEGTTQVNGRTKTSGHITTIAGRGPSALGYEGDGGKATAAKLGWVVGVGVDTDNNVYIADGGANTIRKVTFADEKISTIAGQFVGFNVAPNEPAENVKATATHMHVPLAVVVDKNGNLFVSELANFLIRRVSADGIIKTYVGKLNNRDYPGDGNVGTEIGIYSPGGIAVDSEGNLYYSDRQNNAVRKVAHTTGIVTTIAGLGPDEIGYTGDDGPAVEARLSMPEGIALDKDGNLYIGDSGNNVIRKVSNGTITTIAGSGSRGWTGDGGPALEATFSSIQGLAADSDGNVYVADAGNNVIRKIVIATGVISTVAGKGTVGFSGDGGVATAAELYGPWGVAVDAVGNIYIADSGNGAVRMVYK